MHFYGAKYQIENGAGMYLKDITGSYLGIP